MQSFDDFFHGESGSSRAGREFVGHLAELTFTLSRFPFGLLIADESSGALMSFEQASEFELAVGSHDRVGIDGEIDGELTNGRELIAGSQRSGGDAGAYLIDELAVDGDASVQIKREAEGCALAVASHVS